MGCCGKAKEEKGIARIKKDRGCTDIIPLLAFLASWGAIAFIFIQASDKGADPWKVVYAKDVNGNICGHSPGFKDKPYGVWPHPSYTSYMICVADCNYTNLCTSLDMAYKYPSLPVLGAYCLPDPTSILSLSVSVSGSGSVADAFDEVGKVLSQAFVDIYQSWLLIAIASGFSIIVTFTMTAFLKRCAGVITAFCLLLVVGGIAGSGYGLLHFAKTAEATGELTPEYAEYTRYAAYVLFGLAGLFFLVCLALRKQIRIATAVVKEAAGATGDMKCLMLFPLYPILIGVGYVAAWIVVALFIGSVSTLQPQGAIPAAVRTYGVGFQVCAVQAAIQGSYAGLGQLGQTNTLPANSTAYVLEETFQYYFAAHFFHLLWVIQFLFYFAYLVFAGATADWYFTPRKPNGSKKRGFAEDELSHFPIVKSLCRTLRYHVGTVALTAFIIAVVQFIRAVIMYIERQTRGHPPNKVQKAIFAAIMCCLKCLECCLDKINKNALIWTAIWGDGFCTAACSSFMLLWRNLGRVAAINIVSGTLLMICKVAIAAANTGIFAVIMNYYEPVKTTISSPVAPSVVIFIASFVVATLFMVVFAAVIDTVFLCFLVDAENNDSGHMLVFPSSLSLCIPSFI